MLNALRRLSPTQEFLLVISLAFGWFIFSSLLGFSDFLHGELADDPLATSPEDLYSIMIYESVALLLIIGILKTRHWQLWQFNLQVTLRTTLAGIGLAAADFLIYFAALVLIFEPFFPASNALYSDEVFATLDVITTAAFSLLNGFYEEVLVVGYIYLALAARQGFGFALFTSVTIRLLYHLYQGPIALISIIPMGILFFYVYTRYRRLWPLVVAHMLIDFNGLWDEVCFGADCDLLPME